MANDTRLRDADREAREAALDVSRSCIVQAPAGSGKTELLIQRYLCLLAIVAEPEEVVAITFTRKAALEMQLRVLDALQRADCGETGDAEHEQRTLAAAARVRRRDRRLGWNLAASPRRMRIQTLDAFCASVARLLPVSSGLGGSLSTVADASMTRMYREAAAATLDWLTTDDELAASIEQVLEHLDNNTGDYIAYLARMLGTRDQWLAIVGAGNANGSNEVRRRLEATIEKQIDAQLARARDTLASATDAGLMRLARHAGEQLQRASERASGHPHVLAALPEDDWPAPRHGQLAQWRALVDLLLTKSGRVRRQVNVKSGFPAGDAGEGKAFEAYLAAVAGSAVAVTELERIRVLPEPAYRDDQWRVLGALFRLLPVAVGELKRLFAERGVTDHTEVALAARTALGSVEVPGDAAMLMDYRISHLLVDEMQDTSVGQYRLLEMLTAGWQADDGRTLFCVGDPMQSIYRFRDAEVGQFVASRRAGIGELPLRSLVLRQNFRSGEHLVHWFNRVFSQVLPAADDIAAGAIAYSESVPVDAYLGRGRVSVHPLFDRTPLDEARHTVEVIGDRLAADTDGSIAVLVRSRTQLSLLLAELRAASIPYQAIDIDRLTDLPEVIDLLALTRAVCHHDDRVAWLGLLRGPWAGLDWRDLHALVRNDRSSSVPELIRDPERRARLSADGRERVEAFVRGLDAHLQPHGTLTLRERVESAWLALGGGAALEDDDQLANVYRYLDVLERLESAGTLPDIALLEQQLDEERVSSDSNAHCRLHIMTMHKAKGLQFDHVVLPELGRTAGRSDKPVLAWMNVATDDAGSGMLISPLGPRAELEKDPLYRYIETASRDADRLELDRLLYVACTRARRSLHLIGNVRANREGDGLRPPPAGSLLRRLWPVLKGDFEREFASRAGAAAGAAGDEGPLLVPPRLRRFVDAWSLTPPPAPPPRALPVAPNTRERAVDFHWVGATARHAGTIVHRWLQLFSDAREPLANLPAGAEALTRRWARSLGVSGAAVDSLWRRVENALAGVLADPQGRWLLFGEGHAELRLNGILDGQIESVVIDRVRIDDGCHWIVDYKTGSHEGGDLQGFLAQEADRYRAQVQRYAAVYRNISDAPLRLGLYFPLLQRFVEIDDGPD